MSDTSHPGFASNATGSSRFNVMSFIARQIMSKMWTSTIVQVIAVYPSPSFTVDIQPAVNQIDGSGAPWPHSTIYGVPYLYFQGGTNAIEIDPAVGDLGIAFFASRDISSVKANKAISNPGSFGQFDPADAMYFGAFPGLNGAPTQTIAVGAGGITLTDQWANSVTMAEGVMTLKHTTQIVVQAPAVALGATGGPAVARVGDTVNLTTGVIQTGSAKVTAA
jgi:hypothetical protein